MNAFDKATDFLKRAKGDPSAEALAEQIRRWVWSLPRCSECNRVSTQIAPDGLEVCDTHAKGTRQIEHTYASLVRAIEQ